MALTPLQTFATGDADYISKHNSNNQIIEAALNVLNAQLNGAAGAQIQIPTVSESLFGPATSVIGIDSYGVTVAAAVATIAAGYCYRSTLRQVVELASNATIDFTGLASATYYISADASGTPQQSVTTSSDDLYSVAWDGANLSAITRIALVRWGSDDVGRALVSAALAATYDRLDDRLEAGENASAAVVSTNIVAADITLTAAQFLEAITQRFTGAPAADRIVNVTANAKLFAVDDLLTGGFALTFQVTGGGGTSVVLADGDKAVIYCDGTDCLLIAKTPARPSGVLTQEAWLDDTTLTWTGVAVPVNHKILRVTVEVTEAWNSDGTDLIKTGNAGASNAYTLDVDVSSSGLKTPTAGAELGLFSATAKTPSATYTAGGSATTTGKAHVVFEYVLTSSQPA